MKRHVAMWLLFGLLVVLPFSVAQEPEKPAENAEQPAPTEQQPAPAQSSEPLAPPFDLPEPDIKPTSHALGLIYVQPGTGRNGGSQEPLYALLRSDEVHDAAIAAVAKMQLGNVPDDLKNVEFSITGGTKMTHVTSFDERLPAGLVLESLRKHAAQRLIELDEPKELVERRLQEQKLLEQLRADWARQRQALLIMAKHNGVDVDPQVAGQRRLQTVTELQSLRVELRGLEARSALLEKQLTELANKPNDANAGKVIQELGRVIDARKRNLEYLVEARTRGDGTVPAVQLESAKAELALAEAELAKFRRDADAGNNQRANELRQRLEETLIAKAEIEAKLGELARLDTSSVAVDTARIQVELDEQNYRRAKQQLDQLSAELLRYIPPQVILIRTK